MIYQDIPQRRQTKGEREKSKENIVGIKKWKTDETKEHINHIISTQRPGISSHRRIELKVVCAKQMDQQ